MSLLREIQDLAIDSRTELSMLLRKCKVLAARLGNAEFKQWVEYELSGYSSKDSLPDYRVLHVNSKGHFVGAFGSGLQYADIPLRCIPKELRENLECSYMLQPVASMEALVSTGTKSGVAEEPWNPDLVVHVGRGIYKNMNCIQAWKVIPMPSVVAALDAIRTRILNFVLEIEAEAPSAGEAPLNSNPVSQERVQHIFNTYITGNVQNVATGSTDVRQRANYIERENSELFESIQDALSRSGADSELIAKLTLTVEEMRANQHSGSFTKHYQTFMSIVSDHMQVLGPVVAPFLPPLAAILT